MSKHSRSARIRFSSLALLVFVTIAGLVLGWLYRPQPYVAEAYLRVQYRAPDGHTEHELEFFRETQTTLMNSHFVVEAALSRKSISQLPFVSIHEDPLEWFMDELDVSFVDNSGVMVVSLRGKESAMPDYCKLIDAVIESYMSEVVYRENMRKGETKESKAKELREIHRELEEKLERLHTLTENLGPEESSHSSIVLLQAEVEVLSNVWKELQTEFLRDNFNKKISRSGIELLQYATARRD